MLNEDEKLKNSNSCRVECLIQCRSHFTHKRFTSDKSSWRDMDLQQDYMNYQFVYRAASVGASAPTAHRQS